MCALEAKIADSFVELLGDRVFVVSDDLINTAALGVDRSDIDYDQLQLELREVLVRFACDVAESAVYKLENEQ